jgi:N6-adenosine-specific RNA methylase IME4
MRGKMKFSIICSDPAWDFSDALKHSDVNRGAASNYPTLSIDDIKALPVKDIADPEGCLLALWCPSSLLKEGIEVMEAYDFVLKQTYCWVKTKKDVAGYQNPNEMLGFGMGRLFRNTHEICLIGINSTAIYKKLANRSQRTVSLAPNEGHSIKPGHLQDSLELMFPKLGKENDPQYLELFARRQRKNWVCLGNEIDGKDIREALIELKNTNRAA